MHPGSMLQHRSVGVPASWPSCPLKLSPQHHTLPSVRTAHAETSPVAMYAPTPPSAIPCTALGLAPASPKAMKPRVPFASSPSKLSPQHQNVPDLSSAQLNLPP